MKFEKEEKRGGDKQNDKKKLIIGIAVAVAVLLLISLPLVLGGLQ